MKQETKSQIKHIVITMLIIFVCRIGFNEQHRNDILQLLHTTTHHTDTSSDAELCPPELTDEGIDFDFTCHKQDGKIVKKTYDANEATTTIDI